MPNRVDAAGTRSTAARPDVQQQAAQQAREPAEEAPQQVDRVEISDQARLQAEQQAGGNPRGAAADAPSARPPEAGQQGAVNAATARQAEQVRETQVEATRETAEQPPERQGNLVDVVG